MYHLYPWPPDTQAIEGYSSWWCGGFVYADVPASREHVQGCGHVLRWSFGQRIWLTILFTVLSWYGDWDFVSNSESKMFWAVGKSADISGDLSASEEWVWPEYTHSCPGTYLGDGDVNDRSIISIFATKFIPQYWKFADRVRSIWQICKYDLHGPHNLYFP